MQTSCGRSWAGMVPTRIRKGSKGGKGKVQIGKKTEPTRGNDCYVVIKAVLDGTDPRDQRWSREQARW